MLKFECAVENYGLTKKMWKSLLAKKALDISSCGLIIKSNITPTSSSPINKSNNPPIKHNTSKEKPIMNIIHPKASFAYDMHNYLVYWLKESYHIYSKIVLVYFIFKTYMIVLKFYLARVS